MPFPAEQPQGHGSRGPEDGVSPRAGGCSSPASLHRALTPSNQRWLRAGSRSTRELRGWPRREGKLRTRDSAVGARRQPSGRPASAVAPLPPARAAPPRAAGAGGAHQRLGQPLASPRRQRSGSGCGSVGAAAADSVLGPPEARAERAPLGPSRDHGGTARGGPEGGGPAAAGAAGFQALAPSLPGLPAALWSQGRGRPAGGGGGGPPRGSGGLAPARGGLGRRPPWDKAPTLCRGSTVK